MIDDFSREAQRFQQAYRNTVVLLTVGAIAVIGIGLFVAVHFVAKFW